jgi:hypothetical protein
VVRLRGALRYHAVRVHLLCFGHQELELSSLVPPGRQARAVITLDPDSGAVQVRSQPVKRLQGRRQMTESDARESVELALDRRTAILSICMST